MKQITWEIHCLSTPHIERYCKKCKCKTKYQCSGAFRVNAQKKTIDVWLIYKCSNCDSTWNMTIYSRIHPGSIDPGLLERFHGNDEQTAKRYALDSQLIQKNGARLCPPEFEISGEMIPAGVLVELILKTSYPGSLKIARLLRQKMGISQSEFSRLLETGAIKNPDDTKSSTLRLKEAIRLFICLPD